MLNQFPLSMIFIFSILFTIFCCFFICSISKRLGIVDTPDGIRKVHKGNIALGGGFCIFLPLLACFTFFPDSSLFLSENLKAISLCSLFILVLGLIDDIKPLPISIRLIIQVLVSWGIILITDLYVRNLGDLFGIGNIYIGELGIPLTIFMVVGVTNAFNMLDGMDGLVSLEALVSFISLSVICFFSGYQFISLVLLCSVISTFLLFNLGLFSKKWKVFLGDSGAMWIGFLISWVLIDLSEGNGQLIKPVTALWIVLLPLIDALSTFVSRIRKGKLIFSGDRTHIHHLLLDSGLKKWKVLLLFLFISMASCSFAIYSTLNNSKEYYLFYGFLTLWFFYFLLLKYPLTKNY